MTQALNPDGKMQTLKVDSTGALVVTGGTGGGGGGSGTSNTTEATQLLVKVAVEGINTKTPALSGGKVPVTDPTSLPLPTGAATSAGQDTTNTALGAPADTAAPSDTAAVGLIALVKRALGNWTTLLARIPALVSGRIPVDASGAIQLGAGTVTATTQRVTLASDGPEVANSTATKNSLANIDGKIPAQVGGRLPSSSYVLVADSTGVLFSPDSCAQTLNYTSGVLTSVVCTGTDAVGTAATWTQTLSYTSGNLTNITKWVRA